MAATAPTTPAPAIREAVASFADREHFRRAVSALLAAGFEPIDLSVLASHESLQAAQDARHRLLPNSVIGEFRYIDLLAEAGIVLVSGGPILMAVAALVGAGLGGAALKELFDDYTAVPHREAFAAALKAGAALLWVRCSDGGREARARQVLEEAGGRHVHVHARPLHGEENA